jgi:hypothetical protein
VRSPWVELPYCRAMGSCDAGDVSGIRCNARVTDDREAFASGCALGLAGMGRGQDWQVSGYSVFVRAEYLS